MYWIPQILERLPISEGDVKLQGFSFLMVQHANPQMSHVQLEVIYSNCCRLQDFDYEYLALNPVTRFTFHPLLLQADVIARFRREVLRSEPLTHLQHSNCIFDPPQAPSPASHAAQKGAAVPVPAISVWAADAGIANIEAHISLAPARHPASGSSQSPASGGGTANRLRFPAVLCQSRFFHR